MTETPAESTEGPRFSEDVAAEDPRLWDGDAGTLRSDSRRALAALIKGPYISAERQSQNWRALMADTESIRSRLADMFLDLVVDAERGVAFVRNAETYDGEAPQVVRTHSLTLMDTAMLLHLRRELVSVPAGQRVIIGQDEVFEQLSGYREATSTDAALFAKRIRASWKNMREMGILQPTPTTASEGRYEISPVLRLIFGPDEIRTLRQVYAQMLPVESGPVSPVGENLPEEGPSGLEHPEDPDTDPQSTKEVEA